jgi:hypothetical protein
MKCTALQDAASNKSLILLPSKMLLQLCMLVEDIFCSNTSSPEELHYYVV